MPIPILIWAGIAAGTVVASAVTAYGLSQFNNEQASSSSDDQDAQRHQRQAQDAFIREQIKAEMDAWLKGQQIHLVPEMDDRLLQQLQAGETPDASVWEALQHAAPTIQRAQTAQTTEARQIDEYTALLDVLHAQIHSTHSGAHGK